MSLNIQRPVLSLWKGSEAIVAGLLSVRVKPPGDKAEGVRMDEEISEP